MPTTSDVEEELRERQIAEEFESQKQLDRMELLRQQEEQSEEERGGVASQAWGMAKQAGKEYLKTAAKTYAKEAAASAIATLGAPAWGTIAAGLAIVVLIVGVGLFVFVSMAGACNDQSWVGASARWGSWLSSKFGLTEDICAPLVMKGGRSGGAGGGVFRPPPPEGDDPNVVGCQNCVTVVSAGIPIRAQNACAPGFGPCQVESVVAVKLSQLTSSVSGWQVTEAWPPTGYSPTTPNGIHSNPCHGNATCVDANFTNPSQATGSNIVNFINQANSSGLRAVYEVQTRAQADALIKDGVPSSSIQVVARITASHFSVYNR